MKLRRILRIAVKIEKKLRQGESLTLEKYVKDVDELNFVLSILKLRFGDKLEHIIINGRNVVRLKEKVPVELITLTQDDIKFIHDNIVELTRHVMPTESGLIYEGGIDLALYSAWEESQGDPVKHLVLAFYNLIINHPFINGNKRTATITAEILLGLNGYELTASDKELLELALKVSNNEVSKDYVIEWFKRNTRKIIQWGIKVMPKSLPPDPEKRRKALLELINKYFEKRRKLYEELAKY